MNRSFRIDLQSNDLGQLLDGLRSRAESWLKTAKYLEGDNASEDLFMCEECSDPHEAKSIAQHYQKIITEIEQQVQKQGGWA